MSAAVMAISDKVSIGLRSQVLRQLNHWEGAAERLDDFEATASSEAWASLERYVGVTLRAGLRDARDQLKREAIAVRATFNAVRSRADLERIADQVALLRKRYLQTVPANVTCKRYLQVCPAENRPNPLLSIHKWR